MLNEEIPVFVATFQTQEIFCFRNAITKEIGAGSPTEVVNVNYAVVIGRVEEELDDEITGGWKVLEVSLARRALVDHRGDTLTDVTLLLPADCATGDRNVEPVSL